MARINGLLKTLAFVAAGVVAATTVASAQQGSGQPSVASFLSAVNSIDDELKAFNAEKKVIGHDIHVVNLHTLMNEGNAAVLNKAIARNATQIAALREAFRNNPTVIAVLASANAPLDQVVALDVEAGSEILIYYHPPGPTRQ